MTFCILGLCSTEQEFALHEVSAKYPKVEFDHQSYCSIILNGDGINEPQKIIETISNIDSNTKKIVVKTTFTPAVPGLTDLTNIYEYSVLNPPPKNPKSIVITIDLPSVIPQDTIVELKIRTIDGNTCPTTITKTVKILASPPKPEISCTSDPNCVYNSMTNPQAGGCGNVTCTITNVNDFKENGKKCMLRWRCRKALDLSSINKVPFVDCTEEVHQAHLVHDNHLISIMSNQQKLSIQPSIIYFENQNNNQDALCRTKPHYDEYFYKQVSVSVMCDNGCIREEIVSPVIEPCKVQPHPVIDNCSPITCQDPIRFCEEHSKFCTDNNVEMNQVSLPILQQTWFRERVDGTIICLKSPLETDMKENKECLFETFFWEDHFKIWFTGVTKFTLCPVLSTTELFKIWAPNCDMSTQPPSTTVTTVATTTPQPTTTSTTFPTTTTTDITTTPQPTTTVAPPCFTVTKKLIGCTLSKETHRFCCEFKVTITNVGGVPLDFAVVETSQDLMDILKDAIAPIYNIAIDPIGVCTAIAPVKAIAKNEIPIATCNQLWPTKSVTVDFWFCFDENKYTSCELANSVDVISTNIDPTVTVSDITDDFIVGSCLLANNECLTSTEAACAVAGGTFNGGKTCNGIKCTAIQAPAPAPVPAP